MLFLEHSSLGNFTRNLAEKKAEERRSKYAQNIYNPDYIDFEMPNCKPYSSEKEAMFQIYESDPNYFIWLMEVNGFSSKSLGSFLKNVNMIDDSDSWEITRYFRDVYRHAFMDHVYTPHVSS